MTLRFSIAELCWASPRQGWPVIYIRADVRSESDMKSFADALSIKYGRLDAPFNNAPASL
jgi:NAD(P)-dependent dehydrogenase (short-subunit alcohol dehydrogenase family)